MEFEDSQNCCSSWVLKAHTLACYDLYLNYRILVSLPTDEILTIPI